MSDALRAPRAMLVEERAKLDGLIASLDTIIGDGRRDFRAGGAGTTVPAKAPRAGTSAEARGEEARPPAETSAPLSEPSPRARNTWSARIACLMSSDVAPKRFRAEDVVKALVESGLEEDGSALRQRIASALASELNTREPAWTRVESGLFQLTKRGRTLASAGGRE